MRVVLAKDICEIEKDEYGDGTFICATLGRDGCPKPEYKFILVKECFFDEE